MKIQIHSLLGVILLCSSALGEEHDESSSIMREEAVQKAATAISRIQVLHEEFNRLRAIKPLPKDLDTSFEKLSKLVGIERAAIDAMTAHLKVGDSVLLYPGLLSLGKIEYFNRKGEPDSPQGQYTLTIPIGHSDTSSGGTEPRFYLIVFDKSGVIVKNGVAPRMLE